jgi:20S proteasome subunit alpha 4
MERDEAIKLAIRSLLEVVQTGAKNIEIAVMDNGVFEELDAAEIERISAIIEQENNEQADKKKPAAK